MPKATDPRTTTVADNRRGDRRRAAADARRARVFDAARATFLELGLERASLREIAKRAGYTPGAIQGYFASKEAVYVALLGESLERLNGCIKAASEGVRSSAGPAARLRGTASAFFDFYREHPHDLDLGFDLFKGVPRGLTFELNERLVARLRAAFAPCGEALRQLGLDAQSVQAEVISLSAHAVGLLVLSHTGGIRMFKQESQQLFTRYLDSLIGRVDGSATPGRRRASAAVAMTAT